MPLSESWFVCVNSFNTNASHVKQWERYICLISPFPQGVVPSEFITLCWYSWTLVLRQKYLQSWNSPSG